MKIKSPPQAVIGLVLIQALIIYLSAFTLINYVYPVTSYGRGTDFSAYFNAGVNILTGGNMYDRLFIKPPLLVILISPLCFLGFKYALYVFQILMVGITGYTTFRIAREFKKESLFAFLLLATILLSYPFQFLFDRGNVDAFSLGLSFLGFLLYKNDKRILGLLLFALAVHVKTNVLVLLPALVFERNLKKTFIAGVTGFGIIAILALITPDWSHKWNSIMYLRSTWEDAWLEVGSVYRPFKGLSSQIIIGHVLVVFFALSYVIRLFILNRKGINLAKVESYLLFLPLCAMYPKSSLIYGFVFFPLILLLYEKVWLNKRPGKFAKIAVILGSTGVLLSLFPSAYLDELIKKPEVLYFPPSLGLVLILLANFILLMTYNFRDSDESGELKFKTWHTIIALCVTVFCLYQLLRELEPPPKGVAFSFDGPRIGKNREGFYPFRNASSGRQLIRINKTKYTWGLAVRTPSKFELYIPRGYSGLKGKCGIDPVHWDLVDQVSCRVTDEAGKILWESQPLSPKAEPASFDLKLKENDKIIAVTTSSNSQVSYSVNWVDLKVSK